MRPHQTIQSEQELVDYVTRPRSILMVEDEPSIRNVFVQYAEGWNCKITEAATGWQAIELARHHYFHTVFLDIRLPDISGIEVMKELLAINPNINVVVVSGDVTRDIIDKIMDVGFAMFIQKPKGFRLDVIEKIFRTLHICPIFNNAEICAYA